MLLEQVSQRAKAEKQASKTTYTFDEIQFMCLAQVQLKMVTNSFENRKFHAASQ